MNAPKSHLIDSSHGNSHIHAYGESQAADIALCKQVSDILNQHYLNHPWLIGCNHETGVFSIKLLYPNKVGMIGHYGIMLHLLKTASNHDILKKKVMLAGGELLERWGLDRNNANVDSYAKARTSGLITEGQV